MSSQTKYENLVGWDCSGSVGGSEFYHDKTQQIVEEYDSSNTIFFRWDNNSIEISKY